MEYLLVIFSLVFAIAIKETNGLTVDIFQNPAVANVDDSLTITAIITKTASESWKSVGFYVENKDKVQVCNIIGSSQQPDCKPVIYACSVGFGFTCNFTHFNLLIRSVSTSLLNWRTYAQVTFQGSPFLNSDTIQIKIKLPLQGVSLTPNGTITKEEFEIQNFQCFAKSLPVAELTWHLSGSILPTSSPPSTTLVTANSTYVYTANKNDNGQNLSCTAVYDSTSISSYALINVLYRPIVTISPIYYPYRVLENTTNLQLTCIVTDANPDVISFRWQKDDQQTISTVATYTISTVYRADAGRYTCSANNSIGSSDSAAKIQIQVLYGADIIKIDKQRPHEGTQLSITCSGNSFPALTDTDVTWTKLNNYTQTGRTLTIDNINRVDSGTYVCSVVIKLEPSVGQPINVTGGTSVEIDVLYRPTVTIFPNFTQYKVVENTTDLELDCRVTDANPTPTSYKWFKDGFILEGYTSKLFTILTVLRSHTGSYTCDAENVVGRSDLSFVVQLTVLYGVDIHTIMKKEPIEWTQLVVFCNVTSYPQVTNDDVRWTKQNNVTFKRTGQKLVLDNVNRIDSGIYVCSVKIKLSPTTGQAINVTGTTTVEVNVLYRPTVTVSPYHNQYTVIENTSNLQFTCNVTDSNPAVISYRWYKDGSMLHGYTARLFTMPTVQRSHTGNYTCDATNIIGGSDPSSAVQLNVLYGVEVYPIGKQYPNEGNKLTINCSGQSYPMMTSNDVYWSKQNNNTFSMVGLQLMIENVNRLDSGTYVCSVVIQLTPTVGQPANITGSTTVKIDVLYRPSVTVTPDNTPYKVIENTTNVHLTCNVTDSNPDVTSYTWYKDGANVSTCGIYSISAVRRSHTGSYTCDATNTVGSSSLSSKIQLDVLYGVSLQLTETEININESEKWDLSCFGDGNPLPKITCFYIHNSTIVGVQKNNVTFISVDHANCVDTGLYMCSGNNTIGEPVSQSADIKVSCIPRTYNNAESEYIFISRTDESLNISTRFISSPLSQISWKRELPDGNLMDLNNDFKATTSQSHLPYETISILQKIDLKQDEYGIYVVKATNIHGSFVLKYHVIAKRAPDPPTNITANCDVTSIRVTWISRFDGGENQTFRIHFLNNKSNEIITEAGIFDKGRNETIFKEKESLSPDTLYWISLDANNEFGTTNSTEITNCTTYKYQEDEQSVPSALVGGITGSICALLIVVIIFGGLYFWRRRQVPGGDKEPIKRGPHETDEEEEGLKVNPLYVTSGEASNTDVGPVYGVVNKQRHKKENITFDEDIDQGPVYSQVQKSNKQREKKKQTEKKFKKTQKNADNCKDIELRTVYENSDKLLTLKSSEELYANAGEHKNGVNLAKVYTPRKNKDGLIYADLDLIPAPSGKKFVIRGLENRTNYAIIDLSIKADPLPSDDEDDDKDDGNGKSLENGAN